MPYGDYEKRKAGLQMVAPNQAQLHPDLQGDYLKGLDVSSGILGVQLGFLLPPSILVH